MAYQGFEIDVALGTLGLYTDEAQSKIPAGALIEARNVWLRNGVVEKSPGSRKWNSSALPSGIVALYDWNPTSVRQYFVAVTRDGRVWRLIDPQTAQEIEPAGSAPDTLTINGPVHMVEAGAETSGNNRKLFIFTGGSPVQVISGDAFVRTDLAFPAAEWTAGAHPTAGILHGSRLVAFGNESDKHRLYYSDDDDHEQFQSGGFTLRVFPGESERLNGAHVFNGRLFAFKKPLGAYYIDDSDPDVTKWVCRRFSDSFGLASPGAVLRAKNDVLLKTASGELISLSATNELGDVASADVLAQLRVSNSIASKFTPTGTEKTSAVYYANKQLMLMTYQSTDAITPNRMLMLDLSRAQQPIVTWIESEKPNCLMLRRSALGVQLPFYGAEDGFIYEYDRPDRERNGSGYRGEIMTSHMDFGFAQAGLSEKDKLFDFVSITFEETGYWPIYCDVFIDGYLTETVQVTLTKQTYLSTLELDAEPAIGRLQQSYRVPIHGMGKRVAFRLWNSGLRQNFKLAGLTVGFRVAGHTNRS